MSRLDMTGTLRFLIALLLTLLIGGAQAQRPKIGLALSGGAAKGLAHVGILKAIDSAGIRIDYIAGTSMGAVAGSLYALGYSGDSIEQIARGLDWNAMLSNRISLRSLVMEEKEEYGKYTVELPWENRKLQPPTGVLESQELWLKLAELYMPAYEQKDFNCFSIPFNCTSTDVVTGNIHVIDHGELITAVRASMAIPTIFTAVEIDGKQLVDGGLVRNFPVQDVRAMGANFVIGSSVSTGLLPREKLTDASQILLQLVFLPDGMNNQQEVEKCDIYVLHPVKEYSGASFNRADELLAIGMEQGRLLYPRLKHLVDSLDAIYGPQEIITDRLPQVDSVFITAWEVRGLQRTRPEFLISMMNFESGRHYTATQLSEMIRQAYGTRYYRRIVYTLQPEANGNAHIVFEVEENPLNAAKVGLHYNSFSDFSLIANFTARNLLMPYSRTLLSLNLGKNFRGRAEFMKIWGRQKHMAFIPELWFEDFRLTGYRDLDSEGLYRQQVFREDVRVQYSARRSYSLGIGQRMEMVRYHPRILSREDFKGHNRIHSLYLFSAINTLDRIALPREGWKFRSELAWVHSQSPRGELFVEGVSRGSLEALGIRDNPYGRLLLESESYHPLGQTLTFFSKLQLGVNLNYRSNILNNFAVGGLVSQFRNQIVFPGLPENAVSTASAGILGLGLRKQVYSGFFLSWRSSVLAHDFFSNDNLIREPAILTGHALSLGYDSALGPLEFSLMYNDRSGKIGTYFNLGVPF